jgi:hypothetical protein
MEVEQNFKTHAVDACMQLRHWLITKLEYQRQWKWSRISKPMQLMHAVTPLADNQARIPKAMEVEQNFKTHTVDACSHAIG